MEKTCFIIMPIGDQKCKDTLIVSKGELRKRYDDLIKEAINIARPGLEIKRADDFSYPGTITTDILLQLMNADYIIADISFPNPNVFYELGIRHSCRPRTILLIEKDSFVPFDFHDLRHIEYENTPTGIKELAKELTKTFDSIDSDPNKLDNHLLQTAKTQKYKFIKFDDDEQEAEKKKIAKRKLFLAILKNPKLLNTMLKGADPKTIPLLKELAKYPETASEVIDSLIESGVLKI